MPTVTYEKSWTPRVTLTLEGTLYTAVLEVEGLDPQRGTTAEERVDGIVSLSPPTVQVRARRRPYDTHRMLIDLGCRALASAVASTPLADGEDPIGPGELLMMSMRAAFGVRGAIRLLGEEI